MSSPRVWLITGTSTGFGRALAELVLEKGEIVVATSRRTEPLDDLKAKYASDRLLVLKLDVTQPQDITDAFARVKDAFGRLDVVVNNAAIATFGELESIPDRDARATLEVNFWGAANVARAAVAFFRDVNAPGVGGRLLQISSVVGYAGGPAVAYYSASKFALEGLTQSLALELDPAWNIKITSIQPGEFATEGRGKITWTPAHPAYRANPELPTSKFRAAWDTLDPMGDAKKAAKAFYTVAGLSDPPLRIPLGKDAVAILRKTAQDVIAEADKYEYLSEDLTRD
ncbi:NAD-P-binding protein [Trametes polyzona]|nr:NAD-P-binding protein [Trametes polyzona]